MPLRLLPFAAQSARVAPRPHRPTPVGRCDTRAALASDLFTRPYVDLDDVQARIGVAVAFATERLAGHAAPDALADELRFAEAVLADLADVKGRVRRARAFRDEHGIETIKGLWFAFADHAAVLGLQPMAA